MEILIRMQKHLQMKILKDYDIFQKSAMSGRTRAYIEVRLDELEDTWSRFQGNHYELIKIQELSDDAEYITNTVFDEVREIFCEYKGELKDKLLNMQNVLLAKEKDNSINLPKIELPTFTGKYTEWSSFYNLFEILIHKNSNLTEIEKLYYLKSHVAGEAEQLLRHVPITEATYEYCWSLMKRRYANKRYIANHTLSRLLGQNELSGEDSSGIKQILDTTSECMSALSNLDVDVSTWDLLIIYLVSQKLDRESRRLWEQKISNDFESLPTLEEFYIFLESRFRALEFLELRERKENLNQRQRTNVFSVTAVVCAYCEKSHSLDECESFRQEEFNSRLEFIRDNNLCFNCFSMYHRASTCRRSKSCQRCNGRHHTLLHREYRTATWRELRKTDIKSRDKDDKNTKQMSVAKVILPTAIVKVDTEKTSITLRALLDQGSQASFVTEKAVELLGLRKLPVEGAVTGVGGENQNVAVKNVVQFKIQSTNSKFEGNVEAYVLDSLPTTPEVKVKDWPELSSLKLADPGFDKLGRIDVLLGAEIYGLTLMDGIIRDPSHNLTAQNTELGWIISGSDSSNPMRIKEFKVG